MVKIHWRINRGLSARVMVLVILISTICCSMQNVGAAWTGVPKLLKISDAVKPGKVMSISGEGIILGETAVRMKPDTDGSSPLTPPTDAIDLRILTGDAKGHFVVATFPENAAPGIYNVWVKNKAGWSTPIKLNAPRGMFMSEKEAWNGQLIQVAGRNFDGREFNAPKNIRVRLRRVSDETIYDMTSSITDSNPYCVTFTAGEQPLASYHVEVSNDNGLHWSGISSGQTLTLVSEGSDPLGMGVAWAGSFNWNSVYNVASYNVIPNSGIDETEDIQSAINAAYHAGGGVVYFPNGTYRITKLMLRPHVVLKGESADGTNLVYCGTSADDNVISGSDDGSSVGTLIGHMGVANLKFTLSDNEQRPRCFFWLGHAYNAYFCDFWTNRTADRIFIVNTKIDYPYTTRKNGAGEGMISITRERTLLNNNHWVGYNAVPTFMVTGEYYTEKNNYYEYSDHCSGSSASYAFRENNILQAHNEVDCGVSQGFPAGQLGGMYFKDRTYLYNNTIRNIGSPSGNDGEAFTDDIALGYWNDGYVTASTATSIICKARNPDIPLEYPLKPTFSEPCILIIDGTGLGQLREIAFIKGNTAHITQAWDIQPDTTSRWTLILPIRDVTLYRNTVIDAVTAYQMYGNGIDWVIADNTSENADGVFIWNMRQPNDAALFRTGVIPNYYNRITRNRFTGKDLKLSRQGITVSAERFGSGAYGEVQGFNTEIRENVITGVGDEHSKGIYIASGYGENDALGVTGDITNTIIEDNTISKFAKGIELFRNNYGSTLVNNTFGPTVHKAFVTDGVSKNTVIIGDTTFAGEKTASVKDLQITETEKEISYRSPWLKVSFPRDRPGLSFLALDAEGLGRLSKNLLKLPQGGDMIAIDPLAPNGREVKSFNMARIENVIQYTAIDLAGLETVDLIFTVEKKGIRIKIKRDIPHDYHTNEATPLRLLFDPSVTPPSPMGRLKGACELQFPVLLHFPDHGSLLVRSEGSSSWMFSFGPRYEKQLGKNLFEWTDGYNRDNPHEMQLAVRQGWKPVHDRTHTDVGMQLAGHQEIELDMILTEVYPRKEIVDKNPALQGIKKAWLNSFQFRPDIELLSNNVISDNCAFTLYQFADQAYYTPPLFDDFTAMDLVRTTLEKYFDGEWSYGQNVIGFSYFKDIDPSIIIAAWDYVSLTNDVSWLRHHISKLNKFSQNIIDFDLDGDGIAESISDGNVCTGNSGSGDIGQGAPSVMWWDQIGFGWKDAYSSALHYRAFLCMADFERRLKNTEKELEYTQRAETIKSLYCKTFYNPATGVLGGWRSEDGELHDYYFLYVNGIAISYGLISDPEANKIMDNLQLKLKQVGFTNFHFGLPGNLIPVPKKDMAGWPPNSQPGDFEIYGNGGVSGNHAYLYLQALYSLGRTSEADNIFYKMLEGYQDGDFQGGINFNGHGKGLDWKKWDGSPCGYEGYLVDNYFALTCFITGQLKLGVPFPEKFRKLKTNK